MEFDISRVYSAVNADELKVGSKVILSGLLTNLKDYVTDKDSCTFEETLVRVEEEYCVNRFIGERRRSAYPFAYLVSEQGEKKLKWTDLKIGDVIRSKEANTITRMVTGINIAKNHEHIEIGGYWLRDSDIDKWEKVEE